MSSVTIELPPQATQTQFNLRRWAELLADPEAAKIEWRVETDRYGHIVVMPPPTPKHGSFQSEIAFLLRSSMPNGRTITECPVSTADGVKGADVAWASPERMAELGQHSCFPRSPEICVENYPPRPQRGAAATEFRPTKHTKHTKEIQSARLLLFVHFVCFVG